MNAHRRIKQPLIPTWLRVVFLAAAVFLIGFAAGVFALVVSVK